MEKLEHADIWIKKISKRWTAHNNKIYKDLVSMRVFFFWYTCGICVCRSTNLKPELVIEMHNIQNEFEFFERRDNNELFIMSFLKETSPPLVRTKTFKETWLDARVKFKIWWKELTTIPDYQYLKATWLCNVAILFWLQI